MTQISCALYDNLELAIMHKRSVSIVFNDDRPAFEGRLLDLKVKDSSEYAIAESGEVLLLESVKSITLVP
ncbi:hypothetical protein JX580_05420 [Thiomicrospira microaerophila]|uniref:Rho-binding antiterminator n=1 Tax=Thiomicrospira microaerophila TaxID=406020 RepID=UPI00200BD9B9|nr:Rho-binding antiterminator [Thiomicrospira microaerophila]UQB43309.1 hypothetical protein JX580_05420 [Thiomicrospira microaerophila]